MCIHSEDAVIMNQLVMMTLDNVPMAAGICVFIGRYNILITICLLSTDERYWMPGDTIPTFIPDSPVASSTPAHSSAPLVQQNLADLFHGFQTGIETQLSSIVSSLDRVSERMTKLESQQLLLEKEVKEASKKVISSTSPRKPGKRRREVPTILQVCIFQLILLLCCYTILHRVK